MWKTQLLKMGYIFWSVTTPAKWLIFDDLLYGPQNVEAMRKIQIIFRSGRSNIFGFTCHWAAFTRMNGGPTSDAVSRFSLLDFLVAFHMAFFFLLLFQPVSKLSATKSIWLCEAHSVAWIQRCSLVPILSNWSQHFGLVNLTFWICLRLNQPSTSAMATEVVRSMLLMPHQQHLNPTGGALLWFLRMNA